MKPKYYLDGDSFVIENYHQAPPFANFFPALAGFTGKPLWVFYSNRGQAISSFGINNKDGAMLEFLPANKAYQATPLLGFRTFLKEKSKTGFYFEPFTNSDNETSQLIVRPYEIELINRNASLGLETTVVMFGVPQEAHPLLARRITVKNIGKKLASFQMADGLPRVVPLGMGDFLVKNMSRTIEAFAEVLNTKGHVPFFKLKIEPHDRPDIRWLSAGYFSFAVRDGEFQPVVVDPAAIFGQDTAFMKPETFLEKIPFSANGQLQSNTMPSSIFTTMVNLKPGQEESVTSYYGHADGVEQAIKFSEKVRDTSDYFTTKRQEMKQIYQDLVNQFGLTTGLPELDHYGRVTFMDNVLRGGLPISFGNNGPFVHVFSRKHGDMERDYNSFQISASYYSQGNGNFRDVNQNRRNDLFLNPQIGTTNLETFFNLLQLDGFNPLVINPVKFTVPKDLLVKMKCKASDECKADSHALLKEPVLAGQIYDFIRKYADDPLNVNNIFRDVMLASAPVQNVEHGEGFWSDHWTYNLDHIDAYLSVFPDKKTWLLFEKNDFTFHDSDHVVRPRRDKYIQTRDHKLRQYHSVVVHAEKKALISSRRSEANKVRLHHGTGEIWETNLFTKLLSLAVVKVSSLDPYGAGIEMEADKPGWCDALNGLPGLFGSSSHEMYETLRLIHFLLEEALPLSPNKTMDIPGELYSFVRDVTLALEGEKKNDFRPTWDKLASARETFREKTTLGISGKMRNARLADIKSFLDHSLKTLNHAHEKTRDPKTGLPTSYFHYEVEGELPNNWKQHLANLAWKQHRVVPFLEGAVHMMRCFPSRAKQIYNSVKKSELWDAPVGMFKLNASLADEPVELGRIRIFSRGWLENESIFLHMHYKFLLELLKADMTDIFLKESKTGLIPFRDAESYGRPLFENSSFVASSAFPDKSYHGRGFVARLSGAASEFLSMIYRMAFGPSIFKLMENGISFAPRPQLPKEWFSKEENVGGARSIFSLKLFGVPVTYVNPKHRNTYGAGAVKPVEFEWILEGRFYRHKGESLTPEASTALRDGRLERLKIILS